MIVGMIAIATISATLLRKEAQNRSSARSRV
jgi:hypothetical protein